MSDIANPLGAVRFEGGQIGPHLLITAGVHGDEFESIFAVQRLIDLFESSDACVVGFRGKVTLIPIVNESAFRAGNRCGTDGLDLARTCPGQIDGTVTEQAAYHLSQRIREADYFVDLHTGGTELMVFPLTGYMLHANPKVAETQRKMAAAFNLPLVWGTTPNLDGRSLSIARDANVPAIYCEYGGSATCDSVGVNAYVTGCLNVMGELQMLDRQRPLSRVEHVIEDSTQGSGHMQVCHPAPATGLFQPQVRLGDHVEQGQTIGTVRDRSTRTLHAVASEKTGIVIVLRSFPRVCEGDSIGVVVDLN